MPAGADPRPKKQPTPTHPTTPRTRDTRTTGGSKGGGGGRGLFPQDPTVRHLPHPPGPGAGINRHPNTRAERDASTMFPPTSTHPAARAAARGCS